MSENAEKTPEAVAIMAPVTANSVVTGEISELPVGNDIREPEKRTPAGLARRSRALLSRRLYVADEIASNPLEESRDRLRALEFLARTGGMEDKDRDNRGKVMVVRVLTASGAVEVRAQRGE